ncbi:YIP1 family protein [Methanoregula formicica]|uniref:Yip1 domain protein n=1 Tax=Methanoregula formicica (strain DSM 22288 / NBRC 105244 / SMSP) TaxID=593750 RepID=L0HJW5_METFS|nr:YIP1 family protein [Methanoregula formicica]AGB03359.1 Yip1 domain protein [Methanoregula formicica SMSP]
MKTKAWFVSNFSGYLEKITKQSIRADFYLFTAILLVGSLLYHVSYLIQKVHTSPVDVLNPGSMIVLTLMTVFLFIYNGIIFLLAISLAEHFFVLFISDKPDFEKTMKSVIYASFLPVLFLWIPSVFHIPCSALVLVGAYTIITFYGIRIFHGVTVDRAAFVAIFTTGCILILLYFGNVNLL